MKSKFLEGLTTIFRQTFDLAQNLWRSKVAVHNSMYFNTLRFLHGH